MRKTRTGNTIADAIDEALFEVSALADEMEVDGTPESLKNSTTGQSREAAAFALKVSKSGLFFVPESLRKNWVEWTEMVPGKDGKLFRPARRDNIVRCLQACTTSLSSVPTNDDTTKLNSELNNSVAKLRGVHFPGMSGR